MLKYKNFIILLVSLIIILLVIVLVTPKGSDKAKESDSSSQSASDDSSDDLSFTIEDENLPEGYVAVLGYEDVYKEIVDGRVLGYYIRLSTGEFASYDINKPNNFMLINELQQVYKAVDSAGNVMYYRHFNGKEWDIVDEFGKVLLEIPDNYVRADNSHELYTYTENDIIYTKKIHSFGDGTYAWQLIDEVDTKTTTTTTSTTEATSTTTSSATESTTSTQSSTTTPASSSAITTTSTNQ